jgi:hypothetical protein
MPDSGMTSGRRKLIEEQAEITRLRTEGHTLHEIASRFGKSIYWVNSRLNTSYQPKRLRRAQGDDVRPIPISLDSTSLLTDISLLRPEVGRLRGKAGIPTPIMSLMTEIYIAVEQRLYTLAAMGIRATLENVMKEKVGDRPFKVLVNEFQKAGYLSTRQALSLDVIIEAGHAAIHRGWQPNEEDVSTLLNITESMIETVYLHEDRARNLDKRVPRRQQSI